MKLYIVEVDKNDNDVWTMFGIFSSEEEAKKKLKDKNISPNCSSITQILLDEVM